MSLWIVTLTVSSDRRVPLPPSLRELCTSLGEGETFAPIKLVKASRPSEHGDKRLNDSLSVYSSPTSLKTHTRLVEMAKRFDRV